MADSDSSSKIIRVRSHGNGNTKSDYTEIVVVRHGETEWNAYHKIQGQLNIELNEIGRKQAAAVAQRLSFEHKISAVYSSDLNRAFETALIIANTCGGLEVIRDLDLRDRHMGDLQGLAFSQASKINPKAYQAFKSREINQEIPGGGESFGQLLGRSKSSLERIGNKHRGERVVVVTHCAVIQALHVQARPHEKPGRVPNACLNVFHLFANGEWIVEAWADVTHLSQMGFSE